MVELGGGAKEKNIESRLPAANGSIGCHSCDPNILRNAIHIVNTIAKIGARL